MIRNGAKFATRRLEKTVLLFIGKKLNKEIICGKVYLRLKLCILYIFDLENLGFFTKKTSKYWQT